MRYPVNYIAITCGYHTGKSLDFGYCGHKYQDIMSVADGVVLRTEKQKTGGNCIFIQHDKGIVSLYAHLDTMIVKKGQKVTLGQKIGTMGATGGIYNAKTKKYDPVPMHLHLGLYSKEKAGKGFNANGLHGNADLDPFALLYVYKGQDTSKCQYPFKELLKYYDDKAVWKAGDYILLKNKKVRKSHNLGFNVAKIKELRPATRKYCTNPNNKNAEAILRKDVVCKIDAIYDENGRIWGAFGQFWIVLCNIDGTPQARKV